MAGFEYRQALEIRDVFANRVKDRESLARLRAFREYWVAQRKANERHGQKAWRLEGRPEG